MRMQKSELAQKINKLKGVVPKRTTMPVLQGILVRDGYLIANNMEMTVRAKVEGAEGESFIIPMKAFELIANLPNGEVEIASDQAGSITIRADKIKNRYQTMDPEIFPLNDDIGDAEMEFALDSRALLGSMKRVSYAIPAQNPNAIMTAMCMQAEGGYLNFVGLDGHVLAWDRLEYSNEFTMLVPKAAIDTLLSLGIYGEILVHPGKNSAVFETDEYEIYTRLVEGEYFKYRQLFKELPLHTVIARKEFLEAMTRARMCTEGGIPARFSIHGDELDISVRDSTTDYHETLILQEEMAEKIEIGFDARLVIETLKAFDCDNIGIRLGGARYPMIVEAEDSDFEAIVLPVAIKQ